MYSMWTVRGLVLLLVSCWQTWKSCIIGRLWLHARMDTLKPNGNYISVTAQFFYCCLHLYLSFSCVFCRSNTRSMALLISVIFSCEFCRLNTRSKAVPWSQFYCRVWNASKFLEESITLFNFTWEFRHLCSYIAWNRVLVHVIKALHATTASPIR